MYFLASFSTSLTGSEPALKIKNIGVETSESWIVYSNISANDNF